MIDRLYRILGVKKNASPAELRAAYLRRAKATHPDGGGDATEFQEVALAYEVLGDSVRRIEYDATGKEDKGPSIEDAAVSMLRSLVEAAIADQRDPASFDFIKDMRRQINEALDNGNNQILDIGWKVKRCQSLAKRFKAESNLIRQMINVRTADMQKQIATIQQQRGHLKAALIMLESYEYEIDAPQTQYAMSQNAVGQAFGFGGQSQGQSAYGLQI